MSGAAAPLVLLVRRAGIPVGREVRVGERIRIGRDPDCELTLDHPSVSRRHALISPTPGGGWKIQDSGSANGVLHDDKPVRQRCLGPGDAVLIGRYELLVRGRAQRRTAASLRVVGLLAVLAALVVSLVPKQIHQRQLEAQRAERMFGNVIGAVASGQTLEAQGALTTFRERVPGDPRSIALEGVLAVAAEHDPLDESGRLRQALGQLAEREDLPTGAAAALRARVARIDQRLHVATLLRKALSALEAGEAPEAASLFGQASRIEARGAAVTHFRERFDVARAQARERKVRRALSLSEAGRPHEGLDLLQSLPDLTREEEQVRLRCLVRIWMARDLRAALAHRKARRPREALALYRRVAESRHSPWAEEAAEALRELGPALQLQEAEAAYARGDLAAASRLLTGVPDRGTALARRVRALAAVFGTERELPPDQARQRIALAERVGALEPDATHLLRRIAAGWVVAGQLWLDRRATLEVAAGGAALDRGAYAEAHVHWAAALSHDRKSRARAAIATQLAARAPALYREAWHRRAGGQRRADDAHIWRLLATYLEATHPLRDRARRFAR